MSSAVVHHLRGLALKWNDDISMLIEAFDINCQQPLANPESTRLRDGEGADDRHMSFEEVRVSGRPAAQLPFMFRLCTAGDSPSILSRSLRLEVLPISGGENSFSVSRYWNCDGDIAPRGYCVTS
jgi:hypothetical protein